MDTSKTGMARYLTDAEPSAQQAHQQRQAKADRERERNAERKSETNRGMSRYLPAD